MEENERNFGKPEWTRPCRDCRETIGFRTDAKSYAGFLIPLNLSGTRHNCPNSEYVRRQQKQQQPSKAEVGAYFNQERIVLDVMAAVVDANAKLGTFYLRLERVPKTQGQTTLTNSTMQQQQKSLGDNCKK